jgi:hypothetical protein
MVAYAVSLVHDALVQLRILPDVVAHHEEGGQETAQSLEKFGHAGVVKFLEWAKRFE